MPFSVLRRVLGDAQSKLWFTSSGLCVKSIPVLPYQEELARLMGGEAAAKKLHSWLHANVPTLTAA